MPDFNKLPDAPPRACEPEAPLKSASYARNEQARLACAQATEDILAGRAALDNEGVWRVADGKRAPWDKDARRRWRSRNHVLSTYLLDRVSAADAEERAAKHDLDWYWAPGDVRVCDGCAELHYVEELGPYDEVRKQKTVIARRHVPHVVNGIDLGLHYFHISRAAWDDKCDRYLRARDALAKARAARDAFFGGLARVMRFPLGWYEAYEDDEMRAAATFTLVEVMAGSPSDKEGPLTAARLQALVDKAAESVKRDEDGLAGKLAHDFLSRRDREYSLAHARPRLALMRWVLAEHADKLAKRA